MRRSSREELARIRDVLWREWDPIGCGVPEDEYDDYVGGVHALLRRGGGEEAIVEHLRRIESEKMGIVPQCAQALAPVARSLLRIGVKPAGFRRRRTGAEDCTICEREVPFSWWCACGFRICQECLEENRWGMTCNNITWECPDCGGMRSF